MTQKIIRLVVVDDHALFRRGLIGLLSDMDGFEVVGEAGDGCEVLALVKNTAPDIVLLDVNMPKMDGVMAVRELRKMETPPHILMLTISQDDEDLLGAIKAGADGYLLKNTDPDDLFKALVQVSKGEGVLSPEVTTSVLKTLSKATNHVDSFILSEREMDVLNCLANGQTTHHIADNLFISENTVKTHIRHILEKLEASNRTEAVSKALQMGIIHRGGR